MLGLYVHIPFCVSRCTYCNFVSSTDLSYIKSYLLALENEIVERKVTDKVDTIYIGGGTPSILPRGALSDLILKIRENYDVSNNVEITVEANPDSCNDEFVYEAKCCGVNRVSVGLQSTNDKMLKGVGRAHDYKQFLTAIDLLTRRGINNVSCDLILGLPSDTVFGVEQSIKQVVDISVKHVSLYALKVEPDTPLYYSGFTANEDLQADMYDACYKLLTKRGFNRYEVSNFSKVGYESRHNYKYWTREFYLGFGVGAHSFIDGVRSFNTDNIHSYVIGNRSVISEKISDVDAINESIMLALRTQKGLNLSRLKNSTGYDLLNEKAQKINNLTAQNMIFIKNGWLRLRNDAFYVMNSIITELII